CLIGQGRDPGPDLYVNRDISNPDFLHRGDESTRFAGVTIEKTFALEGGKVLHHRRLAGEAKMILDFACTGGDAFLALLTLNKIKQASSTVGQQLNE